MESLRADANDSHIDGELVTGAHLAEKMIVVFEIHRTGLAETMVRVAKTN